MASYTRLTKKCPNCKHPYYEVTYSFGTKKDIVTEFGDVFIICRNCNKVFRDPDRYELAIMKPPNGYLSKFTFRTVFGIVWISFWAFLLFNPNPQFREETVKNLKNILIALLFFFPGPYSIICDILRHKKHKATIKLETERSKIRLKNNPNYVKMLLEAGYTIPEEYMPEHIKQT